MESPWHVRLRAKSLMMFCFFWTANGDGCLLIFLHPLVDTQRREHLAATSSIYASYKGYETAHCPLTHTYICISNHGSIPGDPIAEFGLGNRLHWAYLPVFFRGLQKATIRFGRKDDHLPAEARRSAKSAQVFGGSRCAR